MPVSVLAVETAVLTQAAGPGVGAVHQVCAPWDLLRQTPDLNPAMSDGPETEILIGNIL